MRLVLCRVSLYNKIVFRALSSAHGPSVSSPWMLDIGIDFFSETAQRERTWIAVREKLDIIYMGLLIVGILVPLVNVLLGGLGNALDVDADVDLDTDMNMDVDGDAGLDSPFPVNITCLFFSFAIVGLVGGRLNKLVSPVLALLTALVCGGAGYVLLYRFVIQPLKRNDASAIRIRDLRGAVGTVTTAIPHGGIGEAQFKDKLGSPISYMIRYNDTDFSAQETIPVGSSVTVVGIEGDLLIVCLAPSEHIK